MDVQVRVFHYLPRQQHFLNLHPENVPLSHSLASVLNDNDIGRIARQLSDPSAKARIGHSERDDLSP